MLLISGCYGLKYFIKTEMRVRYFPPFFETTYSSDEVLGPFWYVMDTGRAHRDNIQSER